MSRPKMMRDDKGQHFCSACGAAFERVGHLLSHIRDEHPKKVVNVYGNDEMMMKKESSSPISSSSSSSSSSQNTTLGEVFSSSSSSPAPSSAVLFPLFGRLEKLERAVENENRHLRGMDNAGIPKWMLVVGGLALVMAVYFYGRSSCTCQAGETRTTRGIEGLGGKIMGKVIDKGVSKALNAVF